MRDEDRHPESPCTNLCVVDPATGWCRGCGRTLDEIARWAEMTAPEKREVLRASRARRGQPESPDP